MQQGTFNLRYPKALEGRDVGLFTQDEGSSIPLKAPERENSSRWLMFLKPP